MPSVGKISGTRKGLWVNPIDVPTITAMAVNPAIRKGDNARHVLRP